MDDRERVRQRFNRAFAHFEIELPVEAMSPGSVWLIVKRGWTIRTRFDIDAGDGREHLDHYSMHRMTNDSHVRWYADGEEEDLPATGWWMTASRCCASGTSAAIVQGSVELHEDAHHRLNRGWGRSPRGGGGRRQARSRHRRRQRRHHPCHRALRRRRQFAEADCLDPFAPGVPLVARIHDEGALRSEVLPRVVESPVELRREATLDFDRPPLPARHLEHQVDFGAGGRSVEPRFHPVRGRPEQVFHYESFPASAGDRMTQHRIPVIEAEQRVDDAAVAYVDLRGLHPGGGRAEPRPGTGPAGPE